jgi:peroxiredoxin
MPLITAFVKLALSLIFGIAGITKLIDQRGTREAVENFGAPSSIAPTVALILPFVELSIAAGLFFARFAQWSAFAALLVLGLFIVAIGVNLSRGNTHDCHCFGQLYSRPLGWPTLARNILFALAAVFVMWQVSGSDNQDLVPTLAGVLGTAPLIVLLAGFVGLVGLAIYLQRRAARKSQEELESLPIGTPAPPFNLDTYDGGKQSLTELLNHGKPLLLLFTNPMCGPCITLFQEIAEWQRLHTDQLTIALITRGTIKENFISVARNGLGYVLFQGDEPVSNKYRAMYTPTGVIVNADGTIGSEVAAGADGVRKLLQNFVTIDESTVSAAAAVIDKEVLSNAP